MESLAIVSTVLIVGFFLYGILSKPNYYEIEIEYNGGVITLYAKGEDERDRQISHYYNFLKGEINADWREIREKEYNRFTK